MARKKFAPEELRAFRTAVVLEVCPISPETPKEKDPPGPGVGVGVVGPGVGVRVGVAVGVPVGVAGPWLITSSTRLVAASAELKSYPFDAVASMASDIKEPALDATCEVMSTSIQLFTELGVKVVSMEPFAGRVL